VISQWDDHEVINDFGAPWTYWNSATIDRPGYPNLVAQGLDAFFLYSPIERQAADRNRIYRSFRWGQDVEVFVLDARAYRDRNDLPDTAANDKDMLGKEQIAWLVEGIRTSTATWTIVSSDVPMSITTGSVQFGRDAWANLGAEPTGFEREPAPPAVRARSDQPRERRLRDDGRPFCADDRVRHGRRRRRRQARVA
jgi:alkaline phosphatase D